MISIKDAQQILEASFQSSLVSTNLCSHSSVSVQIGCKRKKTPSEKKNHFLGYAPLDQNDHIQPSLGWD